jgi:hypothetical protein
VVLLLLVDRVGEVPVVVVARALELHLHRGPDDVLDQIGVLVLHPGEQGADGTVVVAGTRRGRQASEDVTEDFGVVRSQVVRAVVREDDALGLLVVHVHVDHGDLLEALGLGCLPAVVARQNLASGLLDDQGGEEPVLPDRLPDRLDVPDAGVLPIGLHVVHVDFDALLRDDLGCCLSHASCS